MFGIVKTLVGYFAASVSMRFDVDNPLIQFLSRVLFLLLPPVLLLGAGPGAAGASRSISIPSRRFCSVYLNAAVALPLFMLLDRIRE